MISLHFAPVQGHTDAAFRHFHKKKYGTDLTYYTPFIRLEKNNIRPRDIKDLSSDLNEDQHLIPQIIFQDKQELNSLVSILKKNNIKEIDLNMGCPFPLQTGRGRGAATIGNKILAEEIVELVRNTPEINFSVKMRLGFQDPDEWKILLPFLNKVELKHITLHPRVAKQQYGGEVDYDRFKAFLENSKNPVIYNGDLKSPQDVYEIKEKFPDIEGIMIGRGALGRPSLFYEINKGEEMPQKERLEKMLGFHRILFNHYSSVLCGDSQLISKIQPFWEYAEEEIGRKAWKTIKKASNLAKYQSAVALI